jgi:hypothetical protein
MNVMRNFAFALFAIAFLVAGRNALAAKEKPVATVVIDETQVGLLIGGSEGHGVLLYKDKSYDVKTDAVKVGTIGVTKVHLVGEVYRMKNIKDFAGTYSASQAGIALIKGLDGYWLSNPNGVLIRFKGQSKGVAVQLGFQAMTFKLD